MLKKIRFLLCLLPLWGTVQAQDYPPVDITLVQLQADQYEVKVRPSGNFDGIFGAIVFTFRWSASSSSSLSNFSATDDMMEIGIFPFRSGEVVTSGNYKYAPYVAFGANSLVAVGQAWTAGQEVSLGTINVVGGPTDLVIVNDSWTAQNNADFFLSLSGFGATGVIYASMPTAIDANNSPIDVFDVVGVSQDEQIRLLVKAPESRDMRYQLLDAAARTVGEGRMRIPAGRSEHLISGHGLAAGAYTLWMRSPELEHSTRITIAR